MRLVAATSAIVLAFAATRDFVMTASAPECDAIQQKLVQTLDAQFLDSSTCLNVTDVASISSENVCVSSACTELVASLIDQYPDCSVGGYEPKAVLGEAIAACSGGLIDDGVSNATSSSSSSSSSSIAGSAGSTGDSAGVGDDDSEGGDGDAGVGGDETPNVGDVDNNNDDGSDSASGSSSAAASSTISLVMAATLVAFSFGM